MRGMGLLVLFRYRVNQIQVSCGLSDRRCSARVMPKMGFFPKKRMKEIFAYALEFMLTLDTIQNTSPLMCTKFEI